MRPTLEYRDPAKLKNHLLSIELYGEELDAEFLESVKQAGRILEPLRILGKQSAYPEGTIVSGRRRRIAASKCGFRQVPCIVEHELKDKLDIDEQVIFSNRNNPRTTEQRAREYAKLKNIESERAAIRQKQAPIRTKAAEQKRLTIVVGESDQKGLENKGEVVPKIFTERSTTVVGESGVKAAAAVGLSRPTADKAVEVVNKIDELECKGKTTEAGELREKLERTVSGAHRQIHKPRKPVGLDKGQIIRQMKSLISQVVKLLDKRGKSGNHTRCNKSINDFLEAWDTWT